MFTRKTSVSVWLNSYTRVPCWLMSPDPGQDSTYQSECGYQPSAQRVRPGNSHLTGSHFMEKSSIPRNFLDFYFYKFCRFFQFFWVLVLYCVSFTCWRFLTPREMVLTHFFDLCWGSKGFLAGLRDSVLTRLVLSCLVVRLGWEEGWAECCFRVPHLSVCRFSGGVRYTDFYEGEKGWHPEFLDFIFSKLVGIFSQEGSTS